MKKAIMSHIAVSFSASITVIQEMFIEFLIDSLKINLKSSYIHIKNIFNIQF